jgi:CDGSH-type Zn-finger protein
VAADPDVFPRRAVRARRVQLDPAGPMLVEGPIEVTIGDGEPVVIDRFLVALCACGNSGSYPLCDGTHRKGCAASNREA